MSWPWTPFSSSFSGIRSQRPTRCYIPFCGPGTLGPITFRGFLSEPGLWFRTVFRSSLSGLTSWGLTTVWSLFSVFGIWSPKPRCGSLSGFKILDTTLFFSSFFGPGWWCLTTVRSSLSSLRSKGPTCLCGSLFGLGFRLSLPVTVHSLVSDLRVLRHSMVLSPVNSCVSLMSSQVHSLSSDLEVPIDSVRPSLV